MYWETSDEKVLQAQFDAYELALQTVTDALKGMPRHAGESASDLATRMEAVLKQLQAKQDKP